jgi:hypothetical protein
MQNVCISYRDVYTVAGDGGSLGSIQDLSNALSCSRILVRLELGCRRFYLLEGGDIKDCLKGAAHFLLN